MDLALLIGAAVLLVGGRRGPVLHPPRAAEPPGLPGARPGDRRVRARHPVRGRRPDPDARVLRAHRDHRRGRADRPVEHAAAGARAVRHARHGRRGGQHRGRSASSCTSLLGLRLAARAALRRGALVDRRGRGLRHPAPAAAAAAPGGHAGGGVGHQRRPGGPAGRAAVRDRRSASTRGGIETLLRRLRAGRRRGDRVRGRAWPGGGRCAGPRCPSSGLYPIAAVGLTVLAYAAGAVAARVRLPRRLRGRRGARQRPAAAPAGDPRLRRRAGLAGADRPVRAARPARVARPARRRRAAGGGRRAGAGASSPARCRCSSRRPPFRIGLREQAFLSWAGCAGRCRSCWRRSRSRRACPARPGSSTWCSCWW